MELMQLEMFLTVVEEQSFKRAANRVCRTQPAVSLSVARLEQEAGTLLLERSRRGEFRLTKTGLVVYEYASQIIGLRNQALEALLGKRATATERLRIGVSEACRERLATALVGRFRAKYPSVRVEVCHDRSEALLREIGERVLDVALLPNPLESRGGNANTLWVRTEVRDPQTSARVAVWLLEPRIGRSRLALAFEEEMATLESERSDCSIGPGLPARPRMRSNTPVQATRERRTRLRA